MDFKQAVATCVQEKYYDFAGRAPRSEYWWFQLFRWLVITGAGILGSMLGPAAAAGLTGLAGLALFLPDLAVSVRRLHDSGNSGWWILLKLIPFLGAIILFVFFVMPGTSGRNIYGDDPLAGVAIQPF